MACIAFVRPCGGGGGYLVGAVRRPRWIDGEKLGCWLTGSMVGYPDRELHLRIILVSENCVPSDAKYCTAVCLMFDYIISIMDLLYVGNNNIDNNVVIKSK